MQRQYHVSLLFYGHFVKTGLVRFGIRKTLTSANTRGDMAIFYHYLNGIL